MNCEFKENVIPDINDLIDLYNNAGWCNYTNNADMLKNAYENSLYVITAWDNDNLTGAIRVVGDGYSIIYIQDILVLKEYQHMEIGSKLFKMVMNKYKDVYQKVLLTENRPETVSFYEKMGLTTCDKYGCISFVKFNM